MGNSGADGTDGSPLTGVLVRDELGTREVAIRGLFYAIGHTPNTKLFEVRGLRGKENSVSRICWVVSWLWDICFEKRSTLSRAFGFRYESEAARSGLVSFCLWGDHHGYIFTVLIWKWLIVVDRGRSVHV